MVKNREIQNWGSIDQFIGKLHINHLYAINFITIFSWSFPSFLSNIYHKFYFHIEIKDAVNTANTSLGTDSNIYGDEEEVEHSRDMIGKSSTDFNKILDHVNPLKS